MFYSPRRKLYEDVIAVPATATTSSVVINSDELYPFEQTGFGQAYIFIKGDNTKMSVANPSLVTYVSYDEGSSWKTANTTTINNASFVFTKVEIEDFVPRLKLSLDLNGATLAEDHGIEVDVLFLEDTNNYKKTLYEDVLTVAETVSNPLTDATTTGDTITLPNNTKSLTAIFTADASKLTSEINCRLQTSFDGTNWWDLGSAATDVAALDFTTIESASDDIIGNYARFNLTVDATAGAIVADHVINVDLMALSE